MHKKLIPPANLTDLFSKDIGYFIFHEPSLTSIANCRAFWMLFQQPLLSQCRGAQEMTSEMYRDPKKLVEEHSFSQLKLSHFPSFEFQNLKTAQLVGGHFSFGTATCGLRHSYGILCSLCALWILNSWRVWKPKNRYCNSFLYGAFWTILSNYFTTMTNTKLVCGFTCIFDFPSKIGWWSHFTVAPVSCWGNCERNEFSFVPQEATLIGIFQEFADT